MYIYHLTPGPHDLFPGCLRFPHQLTKTPKPNQTSLPPKKPSETYRTYRTCSISDASTRRRSCSCAFWAGRNAAFRKSSSPRLEVARSRQGGVPEEPNVGGENGGGEMFGVNPDIPFKRTAFNHQEGSTSDWKTLGG